MKRIGLLLIVLVVLTSCQIFPRDDEAAVGSFMVELNIGDAIATNVSVIYEDAQGKSSTALLNLQRYSQFYYTDKINLETGNYSLKQCLVLDANDSIIAATPLSGSNMAGSVSQTLPLDFSIEEDEITTIAPEILSYSGTDTPEQYGYNSATATVIGLYDDFGRSINNFTFDISKEVSEQYPGNVFLSPVSLVYAFGLLYPGCGDAAIQEIKDVFYLNDLTESDEELYQLFMDFGNYLHTLDEGVDLSLAHAFWYDNSLTPLSSYLTTINTFFGAEADQIDFSNKSNVVEEINNWAAENTHDKIEEVVTEDDVRDWIGALANATYFKGNWVNGFEASKTNDQTFYTKYDSSSSLTVDMMHGGTSEEPWALKSYQDQNVQLVRIPFKDKNRYEMACVMPLNTTCEDYISNISADDWDGLMEGSNLYNTILNLPKFEEDHKYYLPDALKNLGLQSIFSLGSLSRMFDDPDLFGVDNVIHSTFISVDETGAEAAAVTVIGTYRSSGPPPIRELTFNRPFIYAIQDAETHAIIFLGIMNDPTL